MLKKLNSQTLRLLTTIVGQKNASVSLPEKEAHAHDRSFHKHMLPEIILWPKTTREVSEILKIANKFSLPVTARGGGSSLEGNPIPVNGGIVLNMTRMNKVLTISPLDLQVTMQPGIIGEQLDEILAPHHLWFAAAPGSKHLATIGGMIANNAGGMHTIKYGVVADAVLELEIVLANGDVVRTGSHSFKSSSGYQVKRLFVGSEGTLGIITEVVLKVAPLPGTKVAVLATFLTHKDAVKTNQLLLASGLNPAAIEYMDEHFISLANKGTSASYPEKPTLLIELHGEKNILVHELQILKRLCRGNNTLSYHEYSTPHELKKLWNYRRSGRPTLAKLLPHMGVLSAEVGVPISQITHLLTKAQQASKKYHLQTIMFGHMGDGNFHGWALYELGNQDAWERVCQLNEELIHFAITVGGTTTGEHGIGIGKRKFLPIEHPTAVPLMKSIKKLLDPKGILNPGKIFLD